MDDLYAVREIDFSILIVITVVAASLFCVLFSLNRLSMKRNPNQDISIPGILNIFVGVASFVVIPAVFIGTQVSSVYTQTETTASNVAEKLNTIYAVDLSTDSVLAITGEMGSDTLIPGRSLEPVDRNSTHEGDRQLGQGATVAIAGAPTDVQLWEIDGELKLFMDGGVKLEEVSKR